MRHYYFLPLKLRETGSNKYEDCPHLTHPLSLKKVKTPEYSLTHGKLNLALSYVRYPVVWEMHLLELSGSVNETIRNERLVLRIPPPPPHPTVSRKREEDKLMNG